MADNPGKDNGVFCVLPWTHMAVQPDGGVFPCCGTFRTAEPMGDLRRQELKDIWNSSGMKRLRLNMLAGKRSASCADCYERESAGLFSPRQSANRDYAQHKQRAAETKPDGSLDSFQMAYLDVRFSNECNFRCRICGPWFSTSWYADSRVAAEWDEGMRHNIFHKVLRPSDDPDRLWRQIEPHLDGLDEVYFAGGEPLIMEEHYKLVEALAERGLFHVRLCYSTNLSVTGRGSKDVLPLWAKFKDVLVTASLDGAGRRGEYLRKGQNWESTVENRRRMMRVCSNVRFFLAPTACVFNALHLPDLHWDWLEQGLVEPWALHLNMLLHPSVYRIQILPARFKTAVERKYREHMERLTRRWGEKAERSVDSFQNALNFMNAEDSSALIPKFREWTRSMDALRGENFRETFPELADLMAD